MISQTLWMVERQASHRHRGNCDRISPVNCLSHFSSSSPRLSDDTDMISGLQHRNVVLANTICRLSGDTVSVLAFQGDPVACQPVLAAGWKLERRAKREVM